MVRWFRGEEDTRDALRMSHRIGALHKGTPRLAFAVTECDTLSVVMADQVASVCGQLIKAVNVTMSAETSQVYRLEALKVASLFFGTLTSG